MFSRIDQFMLATFLVVLALMGKVQAQIYTTTLPWAQGDTVIVSQSTDALGETIAIQTLSTIVTGAVVTTTPLVPGVTTTGTRLTTTALAVPTTNTRLTTSTARRATTTTTPAIVATPTTTTSTSALVSTTSWYWFTSDDGNVYSTYYTPSYTTAVSATPAPSGTILDYSEYQASVNSAIATQGSNAALDSGAREGVRVARWGAVWAGVVGAGAVLLG